MAPEPLTPLALRLLERHVDSAGALDLLLLMHAARDRDWSVGDLCEAVRCPPGWAEQQLTRLADAGLIATHEERHRYRRGPRYGPAVDELARACRHDRAAVVKLIFARGQLTR